MKGGSSSSQDSVFADLGKNMVEGNRAPISLRKHCEIYSGKLKLWQRIQPELASVGQAW